jgi:signal recognition particle subunit SRP68
MNKDKSPKKGTKIEEEPTEQTEVEDVKYPQLNILSVTKNAQSQNGLKHGDYKRYRHYCTKRLKRIRKGIKFTHGKKFVKKEISLENINDFKDPRVLQLPLYNAERAWAYAMSLKQELANNKSADPRIRMHIKRRFSRALKWAKLLKQICQKHTEEKTALEAEAYAEYIEGVFNFENEGWEQAYSGFMRSRKIYEELSKVSDSLQKILYQEKIEQIDQSIRYCNFKRGKETLDPVQDSIRATNDPTLSTQIEKLLAEKMQQNVKGSAEIVYHGKTLPIKNEKTLLAMQKIEELTKVISKMDTDKMELDEESGEPNKLNSFIELFSLYDEAIRNVSKEKEEYKAMGEAALQIYILMANYFQSRKLSAVIDRNNILIRNATNKFEADIGLDNVWNCKKNYKGKTFFPQDIVKLYDNLLQVYKQLLELESSSPDYKVFKGIELQETCCKTIRCFYVALTYFSQGKLLEGYSLLVHFEGLAASIKDLERNYEVSLESSNKDLANLLRQNVERVAALKVRAHINILNQKSKEEDKLRKDMEGVNIQGNTKKNENLLQFLKRTQKDAQDNTVPEDLENFPLIDFPPNFNLLPSKPIFLDLGYNYLKYPSLQGKIKEEEKKGIGKAFGKVFGFLKK